MLRIVSSVGGAALHAMRRQPLAASTLLRPWQHTPQLSPLLLQQQGPAVGARAQAERGMASQRHKRVIRQCKGYRGRAKNCFSIAVRRLQRAWQHAYRDRKLKKRDMRKMWIMRVGAATRQHGIAYSRFIPAMVKARVELNRKVLADIAATEPYSFRAVVDTVRNV